MTGSETPAFRLARLNLADATRVDDPDERAKLVEFLRGGEAFVIGTVRDDDQLDPTSDATVPVGFVTDGTWIWSFALGYYTEHHGVAPEPEFYEYIRSRSYTAAEPSEDDRERAAEYLVNLDEDSPT